MKNDKISITDHENIGKILKEHSAYYRQLLIDLSKKINKTDKVIKNIQKIQNDIDDLRSNLDNMLPKDSKDIKTLNCIYY